MHVFPAYLDWSDPLTARFVLNSCKLNNSSLSLRETPYFFNGTSERASASDRESGELKMSNTPIGGEATSK